MIEWAMYPVVVLVFVVLRSLPRLLVNRGALSLVFHDTWFHLLYAEEIAANGHRIPRRILQFLLSTRATYPPLMHWLLSFLPRRWRERTEPFWGGLCDGLAAAALLATILHGMPGGTLRIGLLAVLLFLITPAMLGTGWGPRALHGTPRVFGQMLFTLSALSFLSYRATGSMAWFAAAAFFGSLIFVSSMFSVQVFVFLNLLVALFSRSWAPVGLAAAGFVLSLPWFGGHAVHSLRKQVRILTIMERSLRRGQFDSPVIQGRNRWRDLLRWPVDLLRDPRKARHFATQQNTWLILLLQTPLAPACFLLGGPAGGFASGPMQEAGLYVWAGLALFALTSLRPLLFLGEAERYVEHVVPLLCLTLAFAAVSAPGAAGIGVLAILIAYSLFAYVKNAMEFVRAERSNLPRQPRVAEVLNWILGCANGKRFVVLPRNQMNLLIPYFTAGSVLYGQWASHAPPDVQALRNPASEEFAKCRENLFDRFGIDYVVTETYPRENTGIRELFAAYPAVFQNTEITLLRRCPPAPGAPR
jgi:hypothetical protein